VNKTGTPTCWCGTQLHMLAFDLAATKGVEQARDVCDTATDHKMRGFVQGRQSTAWTASVRVKDKCALPRGACAPDDQIVEKQLKNKG